MKNICLLLIFLIASSGKAQQSVDLKKLICYTQWKTSKIRTKYYQDFHKPKDQRLPLAIFEQPAIIVTQIKNKNAWVYSYDQSLFNPQLHRLLTQERKLVIFSDDKQKEDVENLITAAQKQIPLVQVNHFVLNHKYERINCSEFLDNLFL